MLFYLLCDFDGCVWVYWPFEEVLIAKEEYTNCGIPVVLEEGTLIK